MTASLQTYLEDALTDVPITSVWDEVHFEPIGEKNHRALIMHKLQARAARDIPASPRIHVGVGGAFNFDIIGQTHPDAALLLDANSAQHVFWGRVIALLAQCETRAAFYEQYRTLSRDLEMPRDLVRATPGERAKVLREQQGLHLREENESWAMPYPNVTTAWLEPAAYEHLHRLAKAGKIASVTVDIVHDKRACQVIGRSLEEQGYAVDTCYWSNIGSTLEPNVPDIRDVVSGNGKRLAYPELTYFDHKNTGNSHPPYTTWHGKPKEKVPLYEQMLRNISAIGANSHSAHMLTTYSNDDYYPLVMTDGPPRGRELHSDDIAPRRPPASEARVITR